MRNALMRTAVRPEEQARTLTYLLPAPVKGWISATNLAEPERAAAVKLENWFPQRRSLRARGGSLRKATISASLATQSVFVYEKGAINKLFAATSAAIYNVSNPATPTTIPAADISGQTSGYYSTALFTTAGGTYLTVVNGSDARQVYDGTAWSTLPAITGVSSAALSHVWAYRNRLFFVELNTLNAWYLPVDSIGGAAAVVSLAGVFKRGGTLLTGATWSLESGDGLNEMCAFISTNGEVAVFKGTDPSAPATWSISTVVDIAKMLGKNALLRIAGDVVLLTADGGIPMSMAVSRDRAALALNAVTQNIEPDWKTEAIARPDNWTVVKWPEKNMTIVAIPSVAGRDKICFVINTETGAWTKYTGWDTNCICIYQQNAYFGTGSGTIQKAESGGTDDGMNYTCTYVGHFEPWGKEGAVKVAVLMRSTFIAATPFTPKISIITNFSTKLPTAPSTAAEPPTDKWNVGLWDTAIWDSTGVQTVTTKWRAVFGQGFVMAPVLQVTCGTVAAPDIQLVYSHVKFASGGIAV